MYNLPRMASVRASVPTVVLLLDRTNLNKVLKHYPDGTARLFLLDYYFVKGRTWLAQLVRSLLSDHKVSSSIPGSAEI